MNNCRSVTYRNISFLSVRVLLTFIISGSIITASSQNENINSFEQLLNNAAAFNRYFPQESVYLHIDNSSYFAGETIWFSALIVMNGEYGKNGSGVLYVELLNPEGEVVESRNLKITDGRTEGSIEIKDFLPSGFYELRAYTRYMTNWPAESIFSRIVPVFESPGKRYNYTERRIREDGWQNRAREKTPVLKDYPYSLKVESDESDFIKVSFPPFAGETLGLALISDNEIIAFDSINASEVEQERFFKKESINDGIIRFIAFDRKGNIKSEIPVCIFRERSVYRVKAETDDLRIRPYGKIKMTITAKPNSSLSVSVRDADLVFANKGKNIANWYFGEKDINGNLPLSLKNLEEGNITNRNEVTVIAESKIKGTDISTMFGKKTFYKKQPLEEGLIITGQIEDRKKQKLQNETISLRLYNEEGISLSGKTRTEKDGHFAFGVPDCFGSWTVLLNAASTKDHIRLNRWFSPSPRNYSPEEVSASTGTLRTFAMEADTSAFERNGSVKFDNLLKEINVKGKKRFRNARESWEREDFGRSRAILYYNCDKASAEIVDKGKAIPSVFEWLSQKNDRFQGSTEDINAMEGYICVKGEVLVPNDEITLKVNDVTRISSIMPTVTAEGDKPEKDQTAYGQYLGSQYDQKVLIKNDGLSYKNRPVIWILDNLFYSITQCPSSINLIDIKSIMPTNSLMATGLDDFKSVYISENNDIWRLYIDIPNLYGYKPVTVFLYSHHTFNRKYDGQMKTWFDGYDRPETFFSPDYSIMSPQNDHRRTLYWNPDLKTDNDGRATIEFWNNGSCKNLTLSIEGLCEDGTVMIY